MARIAAEAKRRKRGPETAPRKLPGQVRARETVEAIVSAAAKLCVREGIDRLSTNRIAEAAGVSIGSLYQYFPSKEAVLAALLERHELRMLGVIKNHLADVDVDDLPGLTRALVSALLSAHDVEPGLHRVLIEQLAHKGPRAIDKAMEEVVLGALLRRRSDIAIADLEVGAFLLVAAVEAACHQAVHHRPELRRRDSFAEELTGLVVRYALKTPVVRRRSPRGSS